MDFLQNWKEEMRSSYLYRILAEKEKGTRRGGLFRSLTDEAVKQADIWKRKIENSGKKVPSEFVPDLRTKILASLVRIFGARPLKMALAAVKVRGMAVYSSSHLLEHSLPTSLQDIGQRHRTAGAGGNLRAAVFGVNDGLVSSASLIFGVAGGVAGAGSDTKIILLSGIAGLLAGSFSIAAGEFVSVRSQREMYEYQIGLEQEELKEYPREEAEELALIYEAKGLTAEEARDVATKLIADPKRALDTLAREELGLNPDELGSPLGAAVSSFFSFAAGALVPLAPFLFEMGKKNLEVSVALTGASLFLVGAALSLFTGRSAVLGGLRMLGIGGSAGAVTYLIGHWLGVTLS